MVDNRISKSKFGSAVFAHHLIIKNPMILEPAVL
jgi:hypothetical protein